MAGLKLWFDTDPGVDDALAMALIAARPEFDWIGVSTVFGNASVATTTQNALRLLALLGRSAVPVYAGAAQPLAGSAHFAPGIHGGDGLGGCAAELPGPSRAAERKPAFEAIVRASLDHADLHLVAVGPLTNIAQALRLDPGLAQRVASLTVMGAAFGVNGQSGNVTPCAEANIHNDARAAAEVFSARWTQLRLVGLDATHAARLLPAQLAPLQEGGAVARLLHRMVEPYMAAYQQYYGQAMLVAHDAIAVLPLLAPEAFGWRSGAVRVVEGGLAHGQTLQDWQRLGDAAWQALPAQQVAVSANPETIARLCLAAWLHHP